MKDLFIFLAGSTIILLAVGLVLSANIFGIISGVAILFVVSHWKRFGKVSTKINNILELRD